MPSKGRIISSVPRRPALNGRKEREKYTIPKKGVEKNSMSQPIVYSSALFPRAFLAIGSVVATKKADNNA